MLPSSRSVFATLLLTALATSGPAVGKATKVDVCHARGDGSWNLINISTSALSAHLAHGDVLPGAWYPDTDGDGFGDPDAEPSACPEAGYVDNADDCGDGGAASGPGMEEIADGYDNDCDGSTDEGLECPCFDAATLDDLLVDLGLYAQGWAARFDGLTEVTSLRGEYWFYNEDDAQWQAPTLGADVYRVTAAGGEPYCSTWSQTWLAAPDHVWAADGVAYTEALTEEGFASCQAVLDDWIDEQGVPLTTW